LRHHGDRIGLVDPLVVHPRGLHLDHPGRGGDLPGLVVAIADHEPTARLVPLIDQLGYIGVDFGFQGRREHPPRALPDDLVNQGGAVSGGAVVVDYAEHGRAFPTGAANTGLLDDHQSITREGTPFACSPSSIHRS
jgi:hypothetical protein